MEVTQSYNNVTTPQNQNSSKFNKAAIYAAGSVAGLYGGSIAQSVCTLPTMGIVSALDKIGNLPQDTIDIIHKASEKALDVSGVKNKGVSIEYLKPSGEKLGLFEKFKLLSNPNRMREAIKEGLNAGHDTFSNKILMPENKISFTAFHEIGHSINFNNSKFWKGMRKARSLSMGLTALPMIYGALSKESKAEDGKELNFLQKTNNFIRNNAGKLSFATMLPVLAEEGMASIRGQKLANKLLPKNVARTVLKGNAVAYSSYVISALGFAAAAYTAVKIKDVIMNEQNKSKKIAAQNNQQPQQAGTTETKKA